MASQNFFDDFSQNGQSCQSRRASRKIQTPKSRNHKSNSTSQRTDEQIKAKQEKKNERRSKDRKLSETRKNDRAAKVATYSYDLSVDLTGHYYDLLEKVEQKVEQKVERTDPSPPKETLIMSKEENDLINGGLTYALNEIINETGKLSPDEEFNLLCFGRGYILRQKLEKARKMTPKIEAYLDNLSYKGPKCFKVRNLPCGCIKYVFNINDDNDNVDNPEDELHSKLTRCDVHNPILESHRTLREMLNEFGLGFLCRNRGYQLGFHIVSSKIIEERAHRRKKQVINEDGTIMAVNVYNLREQRRIKQFLQPLIDGNNQMLENAQVQNLSAEGILQIQYVMFGMFMQMAKLTTSSIKNNN